MREHRATPHSYTSLNTTPTEDGRSPSPPSPTHLEISALGSTELLQVEVEHGRHPGSHLRPQEGLPDVLCEVVEGGQRLGGQGEVGAALALVLVQLVQPGVS